MRIVKRALAAIVIIVALLVVIAYLLPRHANVSRSIRIGASPAAIYPLVSDLRRANEWSPWLELDPNVDITFTGPADGVGQTMNWKSDNPKVGSGSQSIIMLDPDSRELKWWSRGWLRWQVPGPRIERTSPSSGSP